MAEHEGVFVFIHKFDRIEGGLASAVSSAAETGKLTISLHQSCDYLLQKFDTRKTARAGEVVAVNSVRQSGQCPTCTLSPTCEMSQVTREASCDALNTDAQRQVGQFRGVGVRGLRCVRQECRHLSG